MKILQFTLLFALLITLISCSGSQDITGLSADEKFKIAKAKFDDEDYEDALIDLQAILLQYAGTAIIDDAQFYLGMCHFKKNEFIRSAFEFSKLIRDYPASDYVKDAQYMLAESYYELSPHYSLDQRFTKKAIEEYQAYIDFFPTDQRVPSIEKKISELNDKLAEKIFHSAVQYTKQNNTKSAIIYYDLLLEKYPDSRFAELSSYNKINLLTSKSRNEEALEEAKKFLIKYPNSQLRNEIDIIVKNLSNKVTSK